MIILIFLELKRQNTCLVASPSEDIMGGNYEVHEHPLRSNDTCWQDLYTTPIWTCNTSKSYLQYTIQTISRYKHIMQQVRHYLQYTIQTISRYIHIMQQVQHVTLSIMEKINSEAITEIIWLLSKGCFKELIKVFTILGWMHCLLLCTFYA